jgi:hypothetical protein
VFLNSLWFLSFHTTHTHTSQMSCRKDRRVRRPPEKKVNWRKWSDNSWVSTDEKPIQDWTNGHRDPKKLQKRNKCWVDSISPQPDTQMWASMPAYVVLGLGHSSTWNHPYASFFARFNPNKWFSYKLGFILFYFILWLIVSVQRCLNSHLRAVFVWFPVWIRCSFVFRRVAVFYWFRLAYQLWSITDSTNDKVANDANSKTLIVWLLLFCRHIICRLSLVTLFCRHY